MPTDSPAIARDQRNSRARITNGSRAFLSADSRTSAARLVRDRERELSAPLGGWPGLSPAERMRVSTAAALSVRVETIRSAIANGTAADCDETLIRLAGALSRELKALDRLAAARRAAIPKPTLSEYLAAKRAQPTEAVTP